MIPLETLPPGDRSGGEVYLRIVLSPEQASRLWLFLNISVLQGGVVSTSPNPQAGGPPLVGCPRLFIQYIRSNPPYRRPFLYPQPEDAPCRGDRDPLHRVNGAMVIKLRWKWVWHGIACSKHWKDKKCIKNSGRKREGERSTVRSSHWVLVNTAMNLLIASNGVTSW